MRKLSTALFALFIALSTTACLEDLDNFDVVVEGTTVVDAATPLELILGDIDLASDFTRFDITQAQGFRNDKYTEDDVDSVRLQSLLMVATIPENSDLSFLGEVIFYVETPNLPRKEIARQNTFPEGQASVAFDIVDTELKSYLLAPEGSVTVDVLDSSRPEEETNVLIRAVFDVDVNVL